MPESNSRLLVESELRAFSHELDAALEPLDLSSAVTRRLEESSARIRPRERGRRRRLVVALVATLAVTATLAIPPARAAITNFLEIGAVRVHEGPPPGGRATAGPLLLGELTTLDAARARMPAVVPAARGSRITRRGLVRRHGGRRHLARLPGRLRAAGGQAHRRHRAADPGVHRRRQRVPEQVPHERVARAAGRRRTVRRRVHHGRRPLPRLRRRHRRRGDGRWPARRERADLPAGGPHHPHRGRPPARAAWSRSAPRCADAARSRRNLTSAP